VTHGVSGPMMHRRGGSLCLALSADGLDGDGVQMTEQSSTSACSRLGSESGTDCCETGGAGGTGKIGETGSVRRVLDRPRRYALAGTGMMCVGLGALGVVVPGLPTTIFLIIASYCFARSCPWLEDRLIRIPLFRPYLQYMNGDAVMPTKARIIASAMLWAGLGSSVLLLLWMDRTPGWLIPVIVGSGVVGTVSIWLVARGKKAGRGASAARAGAGVGVGTVLVEPKPTKAVRQHPRHEGVGTPADGAGVVGGVGVGSGRRSAAVPGRRVAAGVGAGIEVPG